MIFDGPGADEDFGLEQITGDPADRYKFRTSPLRNVALQPAFFHNGAFTRLEDAIRHHLNVFESARNYNAVAAGVDRDLTYRLGPIEPVLATARPAADEADQVESGGVRGTRCFCTLRAAGQPRTSAEPVRADPTARAERLLDDAV